MPETLIRERSARIAGAGRPPPQEPAPEPPRRVGSRLTRVALGIITTLVSVNLWTGGPVFALWVGSRVQSAVGQLSMAAVGATIGVLVAVTYVLYKTLAWLNSRYSEAVGRETRRRQAPWLKPMSGERRSIEVKRPFTATERIVAASVVIAVLAFEVWFLFFAHYSFAS
jgi:hypothetical protein